MFFSFDPLLTTAKKHTNIETLIDAKIPIVVRHTVTTIATLKYPAKSYTWRVPPRGEMWQQWARGVQHFDPWQMVLFINIDGFNGDSLGPLEMAKQIGLIGCGFGNGDDDDDVVLTTLVATRKPRTPTLLPNTTNAITTTTKVIVSFNL
jgi:hypothetical protein